MHMAKAKTTKQKTMTFIFIKLETFSKLQFVG